MASAFFAVLRDAAKLAAAAADDLAAQSPKLMSSADDVASMTAKASFKTVGVAGDDLAVGSGQISGVDASRELPVVWQITKGSLRNKALLIAALLLVDYYLPIVISIALAAGAIYIAYEAAHGTIDYWRARQAKQRNTVTETAAAPADQLTEATKIKGAVRTDLVLSFEMLVIALASTPTATLIEKLLVLILVGLIMTIAVYGLIALIIRLDDMGLALARRGSGWQQRLGRSMAQAAPKILQALGPIGIIAMFMVAGGIFAHLLPFDWGLHGLTGVLSETLLGAIAGALLLTLRQSIQPLHQVLRKKVAPE